MSAASDNHPRHPRPGDIWRSRDPRDQGLEAVVLSADDHGGGFVYIRRFRRSRVRLSRFHGQYEFVRAGAAAPGDRGEAT